MFHRVRTTVLCCVVGLAGCAAEPKSGPDATGSGGEAQLDAQEPDLGITAYQVDGVWIFTHDPEAWHDLLTVGAADIVGGCLFIGQDLVVWHVSRLNDARAAVAAVQAGQHPVLSVGGFGQSVGGSPPFVVPAVIADHCSTTSVWFGAP